MESNGSYQALALLMLVGAALPTAAQQPCDASEADRWIKDIHGRVVSYDELGAYAIEHYGPPVACTGEVTTTFDDIDYGRLRLFFDGGAIFDIETFPPEASVATLSDSSGFDDEASVRKVLERYTSDIGVNIDWNAPSIEMEEDRRVVTYWDPDDGLNASARLVFVDSVLVSVGVRLAL